MYASKLLVGSRLYAVSRRKGMFVLDAIPPTAVIAQNNFAGYDSECNATPAISGKQILLRSNRSPYSVKTGAGG